MCLPIKIISISIAVCVIAAQAVPALYDFPEINTQISQQEHDFLKTITTDDLRRFVDLGTDSVSKELRLEENLRSSDITVHNGSLSHSQLLDTLPNDKAKDDSVVAMTILKSSLFLYNSKCIEHGVSGNSCRAYLAKQSIPKDSDLWQECNKIVLEDRDGHHAFRRLLASNYQDGLYKMYTEDRLPAARLISSSTLHGQRPNVQSGNEALDGDQRNLALVQWAQFVEHDLSKPVATSMKNGNSIECCNHDNYKLQPRFLHSACAPLIGNDTLNKYGRQTCLNYVRSALAVGPNCNFCAAEQLNQATGYLDLSQLYGYTSEAQKRMRTRRFGKIKSTKSTDPTDDMLPLATVAPQAFCAIKLGTNETCFMAGDSRVNNNPLSIVLYTIFMRSHNQIASKLHKQHPEWNDDLLYSSAKTININIYRRIVLNEWLPAVLGKNVADKIKTESTHMAGKMNLDASRLQISNEFAVAAIRFYFSMMPNVLHDFEMSSSEKHSIDDNNIPIVANIFALKDHIYKSQILSNSKVLSNILESLLQQRAMKMDSTYAESFIQSDMNINHSTRSDILAFDIQRGRDHGLQGYVKYLEQCEGITVRAWADLQSYIHPDNLRSLKSAYANWNDMDLIVGGISEMPAHGSTVGPTFTCILGEQFSKIYQWHQLLDYQAEIARSDLISYQNWTGAKLLCANSQLTNVTRNIFKIGSEENPLISCAALF